MLRTIQPTAGVDLLAPTIFHEPWWLDIATEGRYSVVEVSEHGRVVGRWPYFLRKKMGLSIVDLPPLTHFLGPVIIKPLTKPLQRLHIAKELIGKLPSTSAFYVKCHRDVQDIIAFQSMGFRSSVQFTHEIRPQPTDIIWKNMHAKRRNVIRKASARYNVSAGDATVALMQFYRRNMEGMGRTNILDIGVCAKLIQACLERNRGCLYEAREQNGKLAGAIFCAWDSVASYYLMTTRDSTAHSGTISLLVWKAMTDAAKRDLIFDLDGVYNEGGARFAYDFTTNIVPRYIAVRESAPMRVFRAVKSVFRERNCFF